MTTRTQILHIDLCDPTVVFSGLSDPLLAEHATIYRETTTECICSPLDESRWTALLVTASDPHRVDKLMNELSAKRVRVPVVIFCENATPLRKLGWLQAGAWDVLVAMDATALLLCFERAKREATCRTAGTRRHEVESSQNEKEMRLKPVADMPDIMRFDTPGVTIKDPTTEPEANGNRVSQQFRDFIDQSPYSALVIDASDHSIRHGNTLCCKMFQYTYEELLTLRFKDICQASESDRIIATIEKITGPEPTPAQHMQFRKRSGTKVFAEATARKALVGGQLYIVLMLRDSTEEYWAKTRDRIEHDLMVGLAACNSLKKGMELCLEAAIKVAELDNGAFYLIAPNDGSLNLATSQGLPEAFINQAKFFPRESPNVQLLRAGKAAYLDKINMAEFHKERVELLPITTMAVLPVVFQGNVIGGINVASTTKDEIPMEARVALETIAASSAQAIARLHSEQELLRSEEKYRGIFDESVATIYVFDNNKRFIDTNQAGIDLLGYNREELLTMTIADVDADPVVVLPAHEELLTGGRIVNYEHHLRRKDGKVITVLNNSRPLTCLHGNVIGMQSTLIEITEQRAAQQALIDSETNFRTFFETIDDLIFVATPDGKIVHTNRSAQEKLGYEAQEILGKTIDQMHPEELRSEARQIVVDMLQGKPLICPLPLRRKDGSTFPVETRAWRGKWNNQECLFGASKDLSAELDAQQRFETLFRLNPMPMALSSEPDKKFVDVNEAWLSLLEYERDEVIGKTVQDLGIAIEPEKQKEASKQLGEIGRIKEIDLTIRTKSGGLKYGVFYGEIVHNQGFSYQLTVMMDVTEKRESERKVKASEERYRTLFDQAVDGIMVLTEQAVTHQVNKAFALMHGYDSPDEMTHLSLHDLDTPKSREFTDERVRRTNAGETLSFETEHYRKDGSTFPLSVTACRVKLGDKWMLLAFHRDISAEKDAERQRQFQSQRWELALEAANVISWEFDIATGQLFFSDNIQKVANNHDITPYLAIGSFAENIHPDDVQKTHLGIQETIRSGAPFDIEYRVKYPDGSWHWLAGKGGPVFDAEGKVVRVLGVSQDISVRKQVEATLREKDQLFYALFEYAHDGILLMDGVSGVFLEANKAATKLFEANRASDLMGRTPVDLSPEYQSDGARSSEKSRSMVETALKNGFYSFEWIHQRLNGEAFVAEVLLVPVQQGSQTLIQATVRDITEAQQAKRTLEENERLLRLALEVGKIGVSEVDLQSGKATWSDEITRIWRIPSGIDNNFQEYCWSKVHPKDRPSTEEFFQILQSNGSINEHELRIVFDDGTERWIRWRGRDNV